MRLLTTEKQLELISNIRVPLKPTVILEFLKIDYRPRIGTKIKKLRIDDWVLTGILPIRRVENINFPRSNIWACEVDTLTRRNK